MIRCLVDGKVDTIIIGYGPGITGPMAIVVWPREKGYGPIAVELNRLRFTDLPDKLKRKLRRQIASEGLWVLPSQEATGRTYIHGIERA